MDSSANLYKQLTDYDANRKNSVDVLNDAMSKYGIPEIRSRVAGLRTTLSNTESALNAVDPSVTGRTQGSLVTEAQRSKQVANERAPITEQYGQQSRALGTESANLSDNLSAAQLLAQNSISDYDKGRSAIADKYGYALNAEQEQRRREEADRAFRLQEQQAADARRAAASAGYSYGGNSSVQGARTSPAAPAQDEIDAQYLGRLKSLPQDQFVTIVASLRRGAKSGNAEAARRFALGKQLGYWKF